MNGYKKPIFKNCSNRNAKFTSGDNWLMLKTWYRYLLTASFLAASCIKIAEAQPTTTLTVNVNGITHKKGEICLRVYPSAQGFPLDNSLGSQSKCTQIKGTSVQHVFTGLVPGTYAVAVVDDQKGDHKLHRDIFGIPQDGFGISRNPTVSISTGMPKFNNASFKVTKNTTINISMKYSLDP
jgi:uncharacterized protein (DUF2141 family)